MASLYIRDYISRFSYRMLKICCYITTKIIHSRSFNLEYSKHTTETKQIHINSNKVNSKSSRPNSKPQKFTFHFPKSTNKRKRNDWIKRKKTKNLFTNFNDLSVKIIFISDSKATKKMLWGNLSPWKFFPLIDCRAINLIYDNFFVLFFIVLPFAYQFLVHPSTSSEITWRH